MSINLNNQTLHRRVMDASTEQPDVGRVRAGGIRLKRIPLKQQPTALAEIVGLQIARYRNLARQGVALDQADLAAVETLAKAVNAISTAHARLNKPDDEDPANLTTEQLKARAGG